MNPQTARAEPIAGSVPCAWRAARMGMAAVALAEG